MSVFHNIKKGKVHLKWSMTGSLVLGWIMPLLLLAFVLLYYISVKLSGQIEKTVTVSTDKAVEQCELQIQDAISASRNASYMNNIRDCYYKYLRTGDPAELSGVTAFLNQQYQFNQLSVCTMVYFLDNPDMIYFTANNSNGEKNGIDNVTYFRENVMKKITDMSGEVNTDIGIISVDGKLYLFRNLMQTMYIPYGTVVMELNTNRIFESLQSIWGGVNYAVYTDEDVILDTGVSALYQEKKPGPEDFGTHYVHNRKEAYVSKNIRAGGETIRIFAELDSAILIDDLYSLRFLLIFTTVLLIPLVVMIFHFFHNKVTKPVKGLVAAAREIKEGHYGMQIEKQSDSAEFAYLEEAFNTMSLELKRQFEKIYVEELALKDANIMALQAQINPHFLNNTLEIINWEARIQGNTKVSGMIEALSTMMGATMNRENKNFISLKEELEYVKAYFYIISERLGDRFQYSVEVDESLLNIKVPRLIIQPIVENAVEHGMYPSNSGKVILRMRREENMLYIEVKNNRPLSDEDRERIRQCLDEDDRETCNWSGSVGIRNVNRRLKIIYGEECGLQIKDTKEHETISILKVKIENDEIV